MRVKFWLGVLISAAFLYFFLHKLDWLEVWHNLKSVNYLYLIAFFALHMTSFSWRAKRWGYLLLPLKKIKFFETFSVILIGFMGNNIFPARLGEIIRAYVLGRREKVSKSAAMATIVLERLLDGFVVIIFLIGLLWFFPFPPDFVQDKIINPYNLKIAGIISGVLYFAIILFLLVAKLRLERLLGWLGKLLQPRFSTFYEKLAEGITSFVSGLDGLRVGKHLLPIAIYSFLVWFTIACTFYTLYLAFDLQLPFSSAILMMVIVALAVAIPSSPGYVGTFHFASATCLMLLGVEPNKAKSFAIVLHGMIFIPVTTLGLFFVYREKFNLKELHDLESEVS